MAKTTVITDDELLNEAMKASEAKTKKKPSQPG
jgi:Arc/MetJ family transcription regulator